MVLSIIAAVLVVGVVSAGPVLINESSCSTGDSGAASEQTVSSRGCTKCDVDRVQALMRSKKLPKELKVSRTAYLLAVRCDCSRNQFFFWLFEQQLRGLDYLDFTAVDEDYKAKRRVWNSEG